MERHRLTLTDAQLGALIDIMNGAAYADGTLAGKERAAMEKIAKRSHSQPIPEALLAKLGTPPADDFEMEAAAKTLGLTEEADRIEVLRAVGLVTEIDDQIDPAEQAYLERLAKAIGAGKHALSDLREPHGWITQIDDDL